MFLPIKPLATGVSMEIFPSSGSDSRLPTILYVISSSLSISYSVTVEPKTTLPVSGMLKTSIT